MEVYSWETHIELNGALTSTPYLFFFREAVFYGFQGYIHPQAA